MAFGWIHSFGVFLQVVVVVTVGGGLATVCGFHLYCVTF
jgi:hypothetical protein